MSAALPSHLPIRRVLHADLDCFFAAVEELDAPHLRGKPVVVGGDPDRRGVVSTANYLARRYGIHSAMAAAQARRLCPHAVFLRPRFERYKDLSRQVMTILAESFTVLEQVSIDEAYGELPPAVPGGVPAERIGRALKARVRAQTGLIISIGIARSKSIAKLASDHAKPDGLLVVRPESERAFLAPLPVGALNGVGPHTRAKLERLGITTIGQLAALPPHDLASAFGKHGRWLWQLANGQDDRPVLADHSPPKSLSKEITFPRDIADLDRAATHLRELAERVAARAAAQGAAGRTITLKVKWADFQVMTRQQPLPAPTRAAEVIAEAALSLLAREVAPLLSAAHPIRLLGVGLSGMLTDTPAPTSARGAIVQLPLFAPHRDALA
ncbi:MAG TPA: DNA polymerase IV [Ktedonobacterales bacterium]